MITLLKIMVMAIAALVEKVFLMDPDAVANPDSKIRLQPVPLDSSSPPEPRRPL
jgi:hypothetical protein